MPETSRKPLARLLNWAGTLFSLALISYVVYLGISSIGDDGIEILSARVLVLLIGGLAASFAATLLLPGAWSFLVTRGASAGDNNNLRQSSWAVYSITQIYKYLPGNVFHFVGRQVQLAPFGVSQLKIANSTLFELLSQLVISGVLFILIANTRLDEIINALPFSGSDDYWPAVSGVVIAAGLIAVLAILHRKGIAISMRDWGVLSLYHLGYYLLLGVGFWLVCMAVYDHSIALSQAIMIFSLAWLAGTVIPGASAGIGVREAVILALGSYLLNQDLALGATLMRLVSILADIGLWFAGMAVKRRIGHS